MEIQRQDVVDIKMVNEIKFNVEAPIKKEHKCTIIKGGKDFNFIILSERFWAKKTLFKQFIDFLRENGYGFNTSENDIKLTLEENYQKSKIKTKIEIPKDLPNDCLKLLQDPNILGLYNAEFDKRIVKEDDARKTIFIFCQGRLLLNAEPTSFNLCVSDDSGLGKDYVVENVLKMYEKGEDKDYIKCEKTTPEVLDALSNRVDWNQKIFYNADIKDNVLNSSTFKVFSSGAETFYTYKDGFASTTTISGKPVMIVTTARGSSNEELTRRYINCKLTNDIDQTKEIMRRWAKFMKDGIKPDYDPVFKKALKYLKPISVVIPFAEELVDYFPSGHHIMRTQWKRFLEIIAAVTVLYQYQRQIDSNGFHVATWQDYDIAVDILKHLLDNAKQIPLSWIDKKIINALNKLGKRIRISTLAVETLSTPKTVQDRLMHLANFGLVRIEETNEDENKSYNLKKPAMIFSIIDFGITKIPKSTEIKDINVIKNSEKGVSQKPTITENNNTNNDIINNFDNNNNIDTIDNFNNNQKIAFSKEDDGEKRCCMCKKDHTGCWLGSDMHWYCNDCKEQLDNGEKII